MRRLAWIAPMAVAASLGTMIPATASFARGSSGGHLTCVTTSVQTFPGITTAATFVADPGGTVRLKRNLAIDGLDVAVRYNGPGAAGDQARPLLEAQARKRVVVAIDVERTVSWDHTKLAGRY